MSPLLEVRGVTRHFGGVPAVDGIDLEVAAGEIVAVIGPNGAGKSTLLQLINGLTTPTSARRIALDGTDLRGAKPHRIRRAGIATVLQTPRMFPSMDVRDNAALGARFAGSPIRGGADRDGHGEQGGHVDQQAPAARGGDDRWSPDEAAMRVLRRLGLADRADAAVHELTLHDKRLLDLARALAGRPRLVLLDEVMAGLNPTEIDRFVAVVRGIRDELGVAIVWVEHVMRAVTDLADRVIVLQTGRILAEGSAAQVLRDRQVIEAYLGHQGDGHAAG